MKQIKVVKRRGQKEHLKDNVTLCRDDTVANEDFLRRRYCSLVLSLFDI